MTRKHAPIIDYNRGRCACGKWNGAAREVGESVGAFTYRANESYMDHIDAHREVETQQSDMFDQQASLFI